MKPVSGIVGGMVERSDRVRLPIEYQPLLTRLVAGLLPKLVIQIGLPGPRDARSDPIKGNVKRKVFPWLNAEIIFVAFSPTV
jgi:hypothetical protein